MRREATVVDFMRHKDNVVAHERRLWEGRLRVGNVEKFQGAANFTDPHTVQIGSDTSLRGEKILIATGSSPMRPLEFSTLGDFYKDATYDALLRRDGIIPGDAESFRRRSGSA